MPTKSKRGRPANVAVTEAVGGRAAAPAVPRAATAVDKRTAARHIRSCADECGDGEARSRILALLRAVRDGAGSPRRAAAVEAAIAVVLEDGGQAGEDRWLRGEAAAWGLARLAKRRPAAGSAGRHLERLVAEARAGALALADRDTRPARFMIVLAALFADVEACRELDRQGIAAVAEEIGRLVSAEGSVVLSASQTVVDRVSRWTGVRQATRTLAAPGWDDDLELRWAAAAAVTLRLIGGRERGLDGDARAAVAAARLLGAVVESGGRRARATARALRGGDVGRGGLLAPDHHDAAAAVTVIRTGWGRDAVRVLLEYRDATPRLEIAVADRLLVDGPWDWTTAADGRPLDAEGAWTVSCWESDGKAACLEIAAPLAGGMRLDRQIVVLRRERIVLLADAVVPGAEPPAATGPDELTHRAVVRLAPGLEAEPAGDTREVLVYDGRMRCMALPAALPEWRGAGRGELVASPGALELGQVGQRRLYAPLWIDCDPRRIGRPLTWRQLTVADTRRNLPPHQAAGFRIQSGLEQWLLYRALDVARNRTLLGCNVSSGFLLGRIRRSGEVARTVEID